MFHNLSDLSYKRSFVQAIGFYIFFLIFFLICGIYLVGIIGFAFKVMRANPINKIHARTLGHLVAMFACPILSFTLLHKKNQLTNPIMVFIAILSGLLTFFGGAALGLLPTAFLTTRQPNIKDTQTLNRPTPP